jgi:hypothetical protein
MIDASLPGTDVIVTGGDRYYDKDGNIRSSTTDELVPESALYSSHLSHLAVDFYLSNMTPTEEFLLEYFDWVKFYEDGHLHGDIRSEMGGMACPVGNPPK